MKLKISYTPFSTANTLLGYIQQVVPELLPETAVRLELGPGLSCEEELATVSILAIGLKYIWETRLDKKQLYKL